MHHGFLDIAFLRGFPGMALMAAIDEPTLRAALEFMRCVTRGPRRCAIRGTTCRRTSRTASARPSAWARRTGSPRAATWRSWPTASRPTTRWRLAGLLADEGYSVAVYDARFAKPVDVELLRELIGSDTCRSSPSRTTTPLAASGPACSRRATRTGSRPQGIRRLGLPDRWIYQGARGDQLAEAGIDADGIARGSGGAGAPAFPAAGRWHGALARFT